jgi:hypothetical protein
MRLFVLFILMPLIIGLLGLLFIGWLIFSAAWSAGQEPGLILHLSSFIF